MNGIESRDDVLATLAATNQLGPTGLALDVELDFAAWEEIGRRLGRLRDMTAWALGDWLLWGEAIFGEESAQAVEATGRSKATLIEYVRVAGKVPPARRRPALSWSHHQAIAARPPEEQDSWLDEAEQHAWSVEEFRGVLQAPRRLGGGGSLAVRALLEASRLVLHAAERGPDGFARIPIDALDELARVLGETAA